MGGHHRWSSILVTAVMRAICCRSIFEIFCLFKDLPVLVLTLFNISS